MVTRKSLKNVRNLSVDQCIESAKTNGYTRQLMAYFIRNPNATEKSKWVVYSEGNINTNRGNNQVVDVLQLLSITPGKRGSPKQGNREIRCAVANFKNLKTGEIVSCNQTNNPKLRFQLVEYGIGKEKILKPVSTKNPVDNNFSDLSKLSKQEFRAWIKSLSDEQAEFLKFYLNNLY